MNRLRLFQNGNLIRIFRPKKGVEKVAHTTHTESYIKPNGYNLKSHKHKVFNSLVYRLLNIPLEQTEYTKEYEHILNRAVTNSFDKKL